MARQKKIAAVEEPAEKPQTLTVPVDSYILTRDTFLKGVTSLQEQLSDLKAFFINSTNDVLADQGIEHALTSIAANPVLGAASKVAGGKEEKDDKKDRKKRQHDPNAPKRPLTPFFLYMQTARPIIAKDLGPDVPKGQVSEEGTNRWKLLDATNRELWTNAYKGNLRLYQARMHSYKVDKNPDAKDMTDEEAAIYADTHEIANIEGGADAQLAGEANDAAVVDEDEDAEGEPDKEPTPPPVVVKTTPKPKSSRKSKTKAPTSEAIVPSSASASIVPPQPEPTPSAKPEKRKRGGKKSDVAVTEEAVVADPTPVKSASKPRKKSKKSDA